MIQVCPRFALVVAMSLTVGAGCSGRGDTTAFGAGGTTSSAGTVTGATSGTNATTGSGGASAGGASGATAGTTTTTGATTGAGGAITAGTTGAGGSATTAATTSGAGGEQSGAGGGPVAVAPGDLVITEIMNNPKVVLDTLGEWFEIHNATAQSINLAGMVLQAGGMKHTIASAVVIAGGGYAVLGVNADKPTNGGVQIDYQYSTIKLVNTKGDLSLSTAASTVIDTVTYDETSGLDPDGQSRTLDPKFLSASQNDTDAHWCAGTSLIGGVAGNDLGTPGKANDPCP